MNLARILAFHILLVLASNNANAGADAVFSAEEKAIQQKAKSRSYVGGGDEEPLTIQTHLPVASRKMQPGEDALEPDETHILDSTD